MNIHVIKRVFSIFGLLVLFTLFNLLFGDLLQAKISTWGWVEKYKLVSPNAPLIINTREEVRPSDANDVISAISNHKNKVVAVVSVVSGVPSLQGSAVALTSDGLYLTTRAVVQDRPANNFMVVQGDGRRVGVEQIYLDPVTTLAILKTKSSGLSVVSFFNARDIVAGQRILLLGAEATGEPYVLTSVLSGKEAMSGGVHFSDLPSRVLPLQAVIGAMPGQAVLDLSGALVGIWDGGRLVPGSVVQESLSSLLSGGKIDRPVFGFYYRAVARTEVDNSDLVPGLHVVSLTGDKPAVVPGLPAYKAGLRAGDIIVKIGDVDVSATPTPEVLLSSAKPGSGVVFVVNRSGELLNMTVTPTLNK